MLTKETKDKLKKLGFNPDELEKAAKAEAETDITVPDGQLFSFSHQPKYWLDQIVNLLQH